jgi:glycosyltransferase involved in cell wall biosynthesis
MAQELIEYGKPLEVITRPKISVIVPVFNTAGFLSQCLDSLLAQTLEEIEIILVNDASTDHSLELMLRYEKWHPDKIRVIDSKINLRQGGARNLGIHVAQGEYIAFVDSDDWVEKAMFQYLYDEALKEHSDVCYCYRQQIDESGKITFDSGSYFLPAGTVTEAKQREMLIHHITFIQRYIYKRSLWIDNNIRFPEHLRYEDMMIDPLIILYSRKIAAVPVVLYNYRIRSNSTMTTVSDAKYQDKIDVCNRIRQEYIQRGYYDLFRDEINFLYFRKGYIHAALNYIINSEFPQQDVIAGIRHRLLSIDENYRKNPYYSGNRFFCIIDRMISSRRFFFIRLLKTLMKIKHYNV